MNRITPPPLPSSGMHAGHAPQTNPRRPAPTWRAHATDRNYGRRENSARVHAAMPKRLLKAPVTMTGRVARVTVTDAPPQHELAGAQARTWPRPCARSRACTRARGGRVYSRGYGGTATRMHAPMYARSHTGPRSLWRPTAAGGGCLAAENARVPQKMHLGCCLTHPRRPARPRGLRFRRACVLFWPRDFPDGFFSRDRMADLLCTKSSKSPFYGVTVR